MRTTYLDQYTDEHAEDIIEGLDDAGIAHYEKRSGKIVRALFIADWGTRIFVDEDRVDDARRIAERVLAEDKAG